MIRAVFDTNIFISAFLFGGLPARIFELAQFGLFKLVNSPILIDELTEKLRGKFRLAETDVLEAQTKLEILCDVVSTTESLRAVARDPDDDRVIECAVAGRADYIVTGDRHLLELGSFNNIPILTVRQFMDLLTPAS